MRTPEQITRRLAACLAICCGFVVPSSAWSQPPAVSVVDFAQHIKPVLESKCYECHGPTAQSGGVRLDRRGDVLAGGYSQRPLIGGTLKTNEIYLRVASDDPAYRMPKGRPALSRDELDRIRRWVEAGSPWPAETKLPEQLVIGKEWFNREAWLDYAELWVREVPGLITWLCVMLALQCGLLFIERYKQAAQKERAWTTSPRTRWLLPLRRMTLSHYLFTLTVMCLVLSLQVICGMQVQLRRLNDSLIAPRNTAPANLPHSTFSLYGNPPIPKRLNHPSRLSGVYYRGNCERNPELFNGGNYRTATLRLLLVDQQGHPLQYGDRVTPNGVSIRLELERASGTTDALFGDAVAKGVFLTKQVLTEMPASVSSPIEPMHVVKPGWKWAATYPLQVPPDESGKTLSGLVYLYQGTVQKDQARGTVHYGIKYHLRLKNLILEPESELWMGSLFWSPNLETPQQTKVPLKEWFDDEPIPEITGKNSTDPKLLGIPEHLQKQPTDSLPTKK